MKRILGVALIASLALTLAGCGGGAVQAGGEATHTTAPAAPPVAAGPRTWKALPMGVQEKRKLSMIAGSIKLYTAAEKQAGRTPAPLADLTPRFVGYQVQIFSKQADGTMQTGYLDVIGGRIDAVGDTQRPLEAKMVGLQKGQTTRYESHVVPQSAGEKEAVAKAVAWANGAFPGSTWNAEISGYDFYYPLKGKKYVLFTANAVTDGFRALTGPMTGLKP